MIAWLKAQLLDPSSLQHAAGVLLIVGEVAIWHWLLGHPVDSGVSLAAGTLIGGGVVRDCFGPKGL